MLNAAKERRWREGPLTGINNREDLEAWLRTQPSVVAVAFAARAVLRVLPLLQEKKGAGGTTDFPREILLAVFRVVALSWTAAEYPARAPDLGSADRASARLRRYRHRQSYPAAALVAGAAIYASDAAFAAALGHSAAACASAADMAARAFAPPVPLADGIAVAAGRTAAAPFWSAVSIDATHVEEGAAASVIAGSPLWPQGQPDGSRFCGRK